MGRGAGGSAQPRSCAHLGTRALGCPVSLCPGGCSAHGMRYSRRDTATAARAGLERPAALKCLVALMPEDLPCPLPHLGQAKGCPCPFTMVSGVGSGPGGLSGPAVTGAAELPGPAGRALLMKAAALLLEAPGGERCHLLLVRALASLMRCRVTGDGPLSVAGPINLGQSFPRWPG